MSMLLRTEYTADKTIIIKGCTVVVFDSFEPRIGILQKVKVLKGT